MTLDDTPFELPPVMDGYPLEKGEKRELDRVLERYRQERQQAADEPSESAHQPSSID